MSMIRQPAVSLSTCRFSKVCGMYQNVKTVYSVSLERLGRFEQTWAPNRTLALLPPLNARWKLHVYDPPAGSEPLNMLFSKVCGMYQT